MFFTEYKSNKGRANIRLFDLQEPEEISFTSTENTYASRVSGDLTFELFEGRDKKSAEFAGRFFAKLRRNDILDSNVLGQEEVENFDILKSYT